MATDCPEPETPLPPPPIAAAPTAPESPDARFAATGEGAEWFRRLPPDVQEDYRRRWAAVGERDDSRRGTRKRSFGWGALRGAAVFLVTHAVFGGMGWTGLLVAVGVGALLGLLWTWFDAGPMWSAVTAVPVYTAVWLPTSVTSMGIPVLFFAWLIVMPLAAIAGQAREFRQSDGEE